MPCYIKIGHRFVIVFHLSEMLDSCSVNWESKMDNNRSYILYMFTFGLFVPLVAIVVSYLSILRVVKKVIVLK